MRVLALLLPLAACTHGSSGNVPGQQSPEFHSTFVAEDEAPPTYDRAAVEKALITERGAEARGEREVGDAEASGDSLRIVTARADLRVRRRFIAMLELCEAEGHLCPPRLDEPAWPYAVDSTEDPTLDVPLRFDEASWRAVTTVLHGRACACRTQACLDSMDATIERLETRPIEDVQADEAANLEITRARECTMRLRGKRGLPRIAKGEGG